LRVRPPSDADIVDGWPLTIERGFRGIDAVVEVERSSDNPGDPCVPFGVVRRVVPAPGPQGRDSLQIELSDGVVEIAVVPHIISGPVDAIVRLSRGDTHRAMFDPITLRPELGEVWLAGRVVVHDDVVAAVVAGTEPPAIGLPW
jgi:hypothetical protein